MSPLATSLRFLQTQPDARLVALARDGHEAAFEALVRRYRRRLLGYCRRIVGSDSAAEDVLQQALLQAWVAIGRGIEVTDPRPWLYRIVHNVAISSVRAPASPVVELADADISSETDHEAEQRIAVRAALAGLAALPALQREVMLSTAVDGRSYDEIATELGLTNGAVRGLLYRARSTLRAAAAALIPTPLVNWAVRHASGQSSGSSGLYETIAGTGSAGVAGVLLKGGAVIASAGALATAVGISTNHQTLRLKPGSGATVVASTAGDSGSALTGAGHQQGSAGSVGSLIAGRGGAANAGGTDGRGGGAGAGNAGGPGHAPRVSAKLTLLGGSGPTQSGRHGDGPGRSGGDGHSDGGSPGGSDGGSSGSSGGSSGGSSSGSSGSSGRDGGTGGGADGETGGGHDGGGTSGGTTTTSGGRDGGGSDGGTTSGGGSSSGGGTDGHDSSGDGSGGDTTTTVTTTTTGSNDGGGGGD